MLRCANLQLLCVVSILFRFIIYLLVLPTPVWLLVIFGDIYPYISRTFYFLDTQTWNKVIVMMLIRLRWRATTYMVSYRNNRLWRILRTTGGNQQACKIDTNKFALLWSWVVIFLKSHNYVIAIKKHLTTIPLERYSNTSTRFHDDLCNYSYNICVAIIHVIYVYAIRICVSILLWIFIVKLNCSGHLLHHYYDCTTSTTTLKVHQHMEFTGYRFNKNTPLTYM